MGFGIHNHVHKRAVLVLLTTLLLLPFQNCSRVGSPGGGSPSSSQGGGTDGMRYKNYGLCPNGEIDVKNAIVLKDGGAQIVKQNCQELSSPLSLGASAYEVAQNNSAILQMRNETYDRQSKVGDQKVTLRYCKSGGTELYVWSNLGNANLLYGNVVKSNGQTTGPLTAQSPSAGNYSAASGQTSSFSLTSNGSTGGMLTYAIGGGSPTTLSVTCSVQTPPNLDDGSGAAPVAPIQYPNLLANYGFRPGWKVAGVDYPVGVPGIVVLKDPNTITTATTAPYYRDVTDHLIVVRDDNTVLDGWDFSTWTVAVLGSHVTIQNSLFKVDGATGNETLAFNGPTDSPSGSGKGGTVRNCTFDGNSTDNIAHTLIGLWRGGDYTIEYNWFRNSAAGFISGQGETVASGSAPSYALKYNLFENGGLKGSGQWLSTSFDHFASMDIEFNTVWQSTMPPHGVVSGFTFESGTSSTYAGGTFSYNTSVATSSPVGSVSYIAAIDRTVTTGSWVFNDNFVDSRALPTQELTSVIEEGHGTGPDAGGVSYSDNVNMVSGTPF